MNPRWAPLLRAGWRCHLALVVFAGLTSSSPRVLAGQVRFSVEGRVVRVAAGDTTPVAGLKIVVHEVGHLRQGPVDSLQSDRQGGFRFRFSTDTGSVVLVSARYAGIEYFSEPVPIEVGRRAVTGLAVIVSDTSSTTRIDVASRHVVIGRPNEDGTRPVLEIVILENRGGFTRVGADSAGGSWVGRIPAEALQFSVGEGAYSPEALTRRGDSVVLAAPLPPGEKQVLYSYALPARLTAARLPVEDSIGQLTLLVEELDRRVSGGSLVLADTQQFEGRSFQRWTGAAGPDDAIEIRFGRGGGSVGLVLLVGAMTLLLATAALVALGRRPKEAGSASREVLDEIARLDARYAGREGQVSGDEWGRYQAERARLKSALQSRLAQGRPTA